MHDDKKHDAQHWHNLGQEHGATNTYKPPHDGLVPFLAELTRSDGDREDRGHYREGWSNGFKHRK